MYKRDRIILLLVSIIIGGICCLLKLRILAIASDIISVVSISSALYLAAYAGIQASTNLREKLKGIDTKLTDRTQRYVLNSYIKVALILNIVTIISVCASVMISDRIAQYAALTDCLLWRIVSQLSSNAELLVEMPLAWIAAQEIFNFMSAALFAANLIQMSFIGVFIVNRIAFDQ